MRTPAPLRILFSCALIAFSCISHAAPIEVNDGQHTVKLADAPKRVVVLEFSFLDSLAAVGVTPVGAADDGDAQRVLPKVRDVIGTWTSVGLRSQPSIEQIASLKPDLIVADLNRHEALYDDLSRIAPTLMLPSRGEDYEGSLKSAQLIGVALGKGPEMEKRIAKNRAHLAEVAKQIPSGVTVLFGVARESSFSLHGPASYAGSVLSTIGLTVPAVRQGAAPTEFVSLEQLLALNPSWLLVGHYRHPSLVDTWSKQPLWSVLSAVRDQHVVDVDGDTWARNRGVMASEQIVDEALAALKGPQVARSQ
ncbi:Fe(3+) dicitrate ABC transporter substrate-binding protein [Pseudomonas sp. NPDC089408]|uniref:Fe(3+) dicitrate ABC transporter substrate-binding protein n=1 Tax=Pseudomonas sp. NPDC089408 TaxID=3364465 RepID=UPI003814666D